MSLQEIQNKDSSLIYDLVTQSLHFFYFKEKLQDFVNKKEVNIKANELADKMVEWSRNQMIEHGVANTVVERASWRMKTDTERQRILKDFLDSQRREVTI